MSAVVEASEPQLAVAPLRNRRVTRWMEQHVEANPSGGRAEAYLDGLRACAVLAVVGLHTWQISGDPNLVVGGIGFRWLFQNLGWGVELFFLLSGFLLARPWFVAELAGAPAPGLGRYFLRRGRRLVPGYYVSLLVLLALFVPMGMVSRQTLRGWLGFWNIGGHLVFLQHAIPFTLADFNDVNGAYWTLTIEFLFYLSLPILVRFFMGRRAYVMPLLALGVSCGWTWLSLHSFGWLVRQALRPIAGRSGVLLGTPQRAGYIRDYLLVHSLPTFLFCFSLGILGARLVVRHRAGVLRSPLLTPRAGLVGFVLGVVVTVGVARAVLNSATEHRHEVLFGNYVDPNGVAFGLALLVFGVTFGPPWLRRPLESLPLRYIGWVSYGVYLYHLMALFVLYRWQPFAHLTPLTRFALTYSSTMALTLAVASASWLLVERPILVGRRAASARVPTWSRVALGAAALGMAALVVGNVAPHGPWV